MRERNEDSFYILREDDVAWLASDGKIYLIDEMEMKHLINTITLINNKNKILKGSTKYIIPIRMIERLNEIKENYPEYFI